MTGTRSSMEIYPSNNYLRIKHLSKLILGSVLVLYIPIIKYIIKNVAYTYKFSRDEIFTDD